MKRAFDLLLALLLCVPFSLIVLLSAIPAWIECRANPFFVQQRLGRNRKPFAMIKLRTMYPDTAHRASHEVSATQITRTGAFFRRTKIDELPQVWNVLRGDMSFVGPRPCLPNQIELIEERAERGVYALRPGITGPAQVRGLDMSTPRALAIADAEYCGRWSLLADLRLIIATATGGGRGDAVVR
jgi:O-antigen biosynthesis protein WbqP